MAERQYGPLRGPVNPNEARNGLFLKSFFRNEFKDMLTYAGETFAAMVQNGVRGELVFTERGYAWWLFLILDADSEAEK